jgi:hypothetical protein
MNPAYMVDRETNLLLMQIVVQTDMCKHIGTQRSEANIKQAYTVEQGGKSHLNLLSRQHIGEIKTKGMQTVILPVDHFSFTEGACRNQEH